MRWLTLLFVLFLACKSENELGFEPEAETDDRIRLTRCPLLDVARTDSDIVCSLHLGLVLGALPVDHRKVQVGPEPFDLQLAVQLDVVEEHHPVGVRHVTRVGGHTDIDAGT